MANRFAILAGLLVVSGCSNIKDEPLPPSIEHQTSPEWPADMKRIGDALTPEDREQFIAYGKLREVIGSLGGKPDPKIVTVGDAIAWERKNVRQEKPR